MASNYSSSSYMVFDSLSFQSSSRSGTNPYAGLHLQSGSTDAADVPFGKFIIMLYILQPFLFLSCELCYAEQLIRAVQSSSRYLYMISAQPSWSQSLTQTSLTACTFAFEFFIATARPAFFSMDTSLSLSPAAMTSEGGMLR